MNCAEAWILTTWMETDIETTLKAPMAAFLSQYPFVTSGRAKNGCPVNYFGAGKVNAEGILSLTSMEGFEAFLWHQFYYIFQNNIRQAQKLDPNIVRYVESSQMICN